MATDLQMSGVEVDLKWCESGEDSMIEEIHGFGYNPFLERFHHNEWLLLGKPEGMQFHNHDCDGTESTPQDRHELTESNYLQVLESVLS